MEANIEYNEIVLEIEYDYQPMEPTVMYYKDGSGDPGCPSSVEINDIKHCGESIIELLSEDTIDDIKEITLNEHENN